jgi:hypothetical protein
MLQLVRAYPRAGVIKKKSAGTGSTLINCGNIISQKRLYFSIE